MNSAIRKLFKEQLEPLDVLNFVNLQDEKLILAVREHAAPLLVRILQIVSVVGVVSLLSGGVSYFFSHDIFFSIALFFAITLAGTGIVIKELIHWYFHLYVITTRKIIEVSYSPLLSELSNSVLLDQLRCTEIDAEMHGFVSEFFDIGNVTITFDRPTHKEAFTLRGIRSPRKIANLLSSQLHANNIPDTSEFWFKNTNINTLNKRPYRFAQDSQPYAGFN